MHGAKQFVRTGGFLNRPLLCEGLDPYEINSELAAGGDYLSTPPASAGAADGHVGGPAFSNTNYFFED